MTYHRDVPRHSCFNFFTFLFLLFRFSSSLLRLCSNSFLPSFSRLILSFLIITSVWTLSFPSWLRVWISCLLRLNLNFLSIAPVFEFLSLLPLLEWLPSRPSHSSSLPLTFVFLFFYHSSLVLSVRITEFLCPLVFALIPSSLFDIPFSSSCSLPTPLPIFSSLLIFFSSKVKKKVWYQFLKNLIFPKTVSD